MANSIAHARSLLRPQFHLNQKLTLIEMNCLGHHRLARGGDDTIHLEMIGQVGGVKTESLAQKLHRSLPRTGIASGATKRAIQTFSVSGLRGILLTRCSEMT
jgi:hypothetical protein